MGFTTRLGSFVSLVLVLLAPLVGRGQQQDLSIVHLLANAPVSVAQEKVANAHLELLNPDLRFSVHGDRQRLKVGMRGEMDVPSVQSSLAAAGIITSVVSGPPPTASTVKSASIDPSGFPVFLDTGDPALDDEAYRAAKAAWVQSHQQLYQQMIGGSADQ
ncbi:MAG: hypothetical protein ABI599_12825 [Flavobacteriales bacterium]